MGARQIALPISIDVSPRQQVGAITARAIRLALWSASGVTIQDDADALVSMAGGNPLALAGALARINRANAAEPSAVGARAEATLRVAEARARRR